MKLVHCGKPLWSQNFGTKSVSYVFQSDDGKREVEIVVFHGIGNGIVLYPQGIKPDGSIRASGYHVDGLLTAQLRAAELLGAA